jgi:hypothetical protein
MQIISLPDNYSGVFSDMICSVSTDSADSVAEVSVIAAHGTEVYAVKRFKGGTQYEVNIAGCLRRRFDIFPMRPYGAAFRLSPCRSSAVRISAGGSISPIVTFTGGVKPSAEERLLSDAPQRLRIAPDEFDEMAFIAPGQTVRAMITLHGNEAQRTLEIGGAECTDGVYLFDVDMAEILASAGSDMFTGMDIRLCGRERTLAQRSYEILPAGTAGIRVCWINAYGNIDYYTFATCLSESISGNKQRIYSAYGYETFGTVAEKLYVLQSEPENRATMRWLSGMLFSPRVWIVGRDSFIPADVLTDKATIHSAELPSLTVSLRPVKKMVFNENCAR